MSDVTVVGAGAIGGFVAARLVSARVDVTVVESNADHLAAIRAHGLLVEGAVSLATRPRVMAPGELDEPLGLTLLAVKARHTAEALATIEPRLSADGAVVSLQNGLEEYRSAESVGAARTIGAALTFGGHYARPGVVHYGGRGSLHVGELDGARTERIGRIAELLSLAHPAEVSENIFADLWSKEALGAFYFATALIDADVLEILERPDVLAVLGGLVAEVGRVAAAEGVELGAVDGFDPSAFVRADDAGIGASWESQRRYWRGLQARRTGVWRDLNVHRRQTELEQIVVPVLERAGRHGIETPLLGRLAELVREAERGRVEHGYDAVLELA